MTALFALPSFAAEAPAGPPAPASASAPAPSAAAQAPAFDPAVPSTWRTSAKLGKGSPAREALIAELAKKPGDPYEASLTREEAQAVLDDPRAELIYGDKTVSIVAPSMVVRHRKEHQDLLKIFLQKERLQAGAKFFREKQQVLSRAADKHKVDAAVVVSILMWESRLGTITGEFFAFNSFVSQGWFAEEASAVSLKSAAEKKLLDPKRQPERVATVQERARRNLVVLLRQCKAKGIDPLSVKGSWAGALGFPQFMPASLRWAEDGDGDGKIDLYTFDDSIASIARYLSEHGFAKSREKAVWDYNHEDAYVKGVLAYADALTAELGAGAKAAGESAAAPPAAGADSGQESAKASP